MHKTCSFLTPFPGHILVFGQWNFQVEAYEWVTCAVMMPMER
jgi:hypothetical protein